MATEAVQIKGKADLLQAYRFQDIPAFGVWCKKDLHYSFVTDDIDVGAENLSKWLELVERSNNSHATYRLALYKDVPDNGHIKNTTGYDTCFNFKLRDYEDLPAQTGGSITNMMGLARELYDIKVQQQIILEHLQANEEEESIPATAPTKSVGELAIEQLMPVIPKIAEGIASMIFPRIGQVSGITLTDVVDTSYVDGVAALNRLRKVVPNPPGADLLICRLADLAEKKPDDFAFYLRSLMSMKF